MRAVALVTLVALLAGCAGGKKGPSPSPVPTATSTATPCATSLLTLHLLSHKVHIFKPHLTGSQANLNVSRGTCPTPAPGVLEYNGGPVQSTPKIYVDFWGPWKSGGDPSNAAVFLLSFYDSDGGTSWLSTVTQYGETDGAFTGNQSNMLSGSWFSTDAIPNSPTDTDLGNEAAKAAAHFGVSGVNVQIIVASAHGITPVGFISQYCAWHSTEGSVTFTNLPYIADAGSSCGAGLLSSPGTLDGLTIVAGHEQAESMTDPEINAWYDANGSEIGDLCAWVNVAQGITGFATQPLWSNKANACVQ